MTRKKWAVVTSVLLLLSLAAWLVGCKPDAEEIEVAGVRYGQYGSAAFHGSVIVDNDLTVTDTLNVDGDLDYDGDGFDVDTTGAISLDADVASNFNTAGAGIDLTLEAEAGRVIIKGDEAAAAAVHIDANDAGGTGLDIDVGATGGMSVDGGCLNIGGGTPGSCGDNDLYVTGDLEVDTALDVDGATTLDDVDIDLAAEMNIDGELVCIGATGDGGTADGDNDLIVKGDMEVDETLDVDGDIDLDGDGFDVDITAGWSIDGDAASNLTTNTGDLTIANTDKSIIIKPDEGAANALYIDADADAATGVDIDVGATNGLSIDGGMVNIGTCTAGVASGDNDLCVAGVVEVDGELELDGALDADSTSDFADTATFSKGSGVAISISAGGTLTLPATADIASHGYVSIGDGTPDGSVSAGTDEQLYVEGAVEIDGELELDGALDADSTSNFADTATFSKGSGNAIAVSAGGDIALGAGSTITPSGAAQGGVVFATSIDIVFSITTTVTGPVIPANANVVDWKLIVSTVFDGSGDNTVTCGSAGDADKYVDDVDVESAGVNVAGDAADMQQDEWASSWGDVGGANLAIQCLYTDSVTDGTAGVATFIIWYIID